MYSALGSDQHEYAIKCVDLTQADELTAQSYVNEIHLLKRLQYSQRIIKMYDLWVFSCVIFGSDLRLSYPDYTV